MNAYLEDIKDETIKAAKDLGYGKHVVEKIRKAKKESEIQRIMITERHKRLD